MRSCARCAEAGARVVIATRDHARSEDVALELGAVAVATDVTSQESVVAMLERVSEELGPVDGWFCEEYNQSDPSTGGRGAMFKRIMEFLTLKWLWDRRKSRTRRKR
jgi:NAD(P)-dependent dehydrogenase (short-subunit alcohol dehydrogenase family)